MKIETATGTKGKGDKEMKYEVYDMMTRRQTAFASFEEMLNAGGNYYPTLCTSGHGRKERELLANAYDRAQRERGDKRRASRF